MFFFVSGFYFNFLFELNAPFMSCRVLVTQLKYFKNVIAANISAVDWSHRSNISKITFRQIFLQEIGHTAQIFQKYHFSKYFCRGLVTQLKYFKNIISANIFWRGFRHTTQIFQKYNSSKYFCRGLVTQLKYFKNIISANISAGDWSHSSPCFAFFACSPFADPAVPPCW